MADSKNVVVDSTEEVVEAELKHEKVTPMPESKNEAAKEPESAPDSEGTQNEQVIRHPSYSALPLAEIIRIIDRHSEVKPEFRDMIAGLSNWMYDKRIEILDGIVDDLIKLLTANVSVHDMIVNIALLDTADIVRQGEPIYGWQDAPVSIAYDNTVQYFLDSALDVEGQTQAAPFYALRELIRLIWLVKNRPDRMDLPMYNVTDEGEAAEAAPEVHTDGNEVSADEK